MNLKNFDFLDFGASKGASLDFGKAKLLGKKGLGIDLDPERVKKMNEAGYDCIVGDLTDLDLPANCVRFVKMVHILEHMPNLEGVEKALVSAKKAATEFLVITGPFFDEDEYLKSKGFKLHWSDYPEHTCHLTVEQLIDILKKLKLDNFEVYVRYKINDSSHEHIHPLSSPPGSHHYNPAKHPPKKHVEFTQYVWTDFVCYVKLKDNIKNWPEIKKAYANLIPYFEMKNGKPHIWPKGTLEMLIEADADSQKKDKTIIALKQQTKSLQERAGKAEKELSNLHSSKSWKAVKLVQKGTQVARKPKELLKRSRHP